MVQALVDDMEKQGVCVVGLLFGYVFLGLSLSAPIGPSAAEACPSTVGLFSIGAKRTL